MNRFLIFHISWIFVCLFIIVIGDSTPVEWASKGMQSLSRVIIWTTLSVSMVWVFNYAMGLHRKKIGALLYLITIPFLFFSMLGDFMCGDAEKTMYVHTQTKATIVSRSYGCGAWDSDMPVYRYYKKQRFLGIFYWLSKTDTAKLDKTVWQKQ